jgi:hypothetical protein
MSTTKQASLKTLPFFHKEFTTSHSTFLVIGTSMANKFGNVPTSGVYLLYDFTCLGALVFIIKPTTLQNIREDNITMKADYTLDSCNSGQGQVAGKWNLPRAHHEGI